ncbi:MAG: hypothetical protein U1E83_02390 [Methylotetracoccus sp.]
MIDLPYSLIIEATENPEVFGFHSPELDGFGGVGHSIEDCIYRARWGMREHVEMIAEQGIPIPPATKHPTITIRNQADATLARNYRPVLASSRQIA